MVRTNLKWPLPIAEKGEIKILLFSVDSIHLDSQAYCIHTTAYAAFNFQKMFLCLLIEGII